MKNLLRICAGVALLLLSAAPASAVENAFGSPEQQRTMIAGICQTQLSIGEAGCRCLAERAIGELSDPQREYLIMTVVQPPVAERLPMARSQADLGVIATFIDSAREECPAVPAPAAEPQEGEAPAAEGAPAQ